jgi:hypothetical protein
MPLSSSVSTPPYSNAFCSYEETFEARSGVQEQMGAKSEGRGPKTKNRKTSIILKYVSLIPLAPVYVGSRLGGKSSTPFLLFQRRKD